MKWNSKEIDIYLTSKEYVDTAFITLIPISFNGEMKQSVAMGEFSTVLTNEIERQLHGRTLAFPPFTYLKSEEREKKLNRLKEWTSKLFEQGFQHLFLFTSDTEWKQFEHDLDAALIWLPVIPLEHMDGKYKAEILQEQTKQLLQIVTNKWQTES
ncbi:DUF2487 domain-containing protein [Pueribacillus theae]|uniref:DUF2487 domain-containing protein n=1 Tax=Pueribacillus theae TaxID=2171751 RepID=A0A2U1K4D4_9BACI|nr:YpiF family protein [Pueribacillus theae]PWA12356.1 DUF2487 domain-containing protein [Pueribacillus theae]